jgi:hypothetical protein
MTGHKYATGAALRTALEERLRGIAREEAVDLQRLRRQVAFDRFLTRLFSRPGSSWVLKGGYAMELRFQTARATKDLDFTVRTVPGGRVGGDAVLVALSRPRCIGAGSQLRFDKKDWVDFLGGKYRGGGVSVAETGLSFQEGTERLRGEVSEVFTGGEWKLK